MEKLRTATMLGEIKPIGTAHGVLNTLITDYADPENWYMKQFVTEDQLREFAMQHRLAILEE